ncbi:hypothetical protein ACFVZQ_12065, partial [Streptomyces sp. NPDC059538]
MIFPLTVDRILADRSRAECGRSVITVPAPGGAHVVVGGHDFAGSGDGHPIGLYAAAPLPEGETEAPDPSADAPALYWLRTRWPLRAAAFHPTRPLLALGTGSYDGGYFFEGELVLVDLATGEHRYLFADDCRREVRSLEWTDAHSLRLLLAPPDDWQDRAARSEGHRVDLVRPDWRTVPARSVRHADLAGAPLPAPRPAPNPPRARAGPVGAPPRAIPRPSGE